MRDMKYTLIRSLVRLLARLLITKSILFSVHSFIHSFVNSSSCEIRLIPTYVHEGTIFKLSRQMSPPLKKS